VVFKVWRGGLAYYGGFLFAVAFGFYYVHRHRLPAWRVADLAGYAIPLGLVFGRLGCVLNGCCFGRPTDLPLGLTFPGHGGAWRAQVDAGIIAKNAPHALPVHPTQLYESFACLLIFLFLYFFVRNRKRFDGQVFALLLVLYAVARSIIEIVRADERGVFFGFLSTSQIISVPLFATGIALLILLRKKAASLPAESRT